MNKYMVLESFKIRIGSHTQNLNGTGNIILNVGDIIYHDCDAPDGHVWFYSEFPKNAFDYSHRGFIMSGEITNLVNDGTIELIE